MSDPNIDPNIVTDFIKSHPALVSLDSAARTYLYSNASTQTLKKGEAVFHRLDKPEYFYYIAKGSVRLENSYGTKSKVAGDFIGSDHVFSPSTFQNDAICQEDTVLILFELPFMKTFIDDHPKIMPGLLRTTSANAIKAEVDIKKEITTWESIGFLSTLAIPVLVFHIMGGTWVDPAITLFMCILSATVTMWFFRLFSSYVPALFFLLAILVLGLAPPEIVLSGFATKTFIILLSTFTIGATILVSGLGHRIMLLFFSKFSKSYQNSALALFSSGLFLTPLMPAILARAEIAAPMFLEANRVLQLQKGSRATTHLAITLFFSISLFSNVFLSGSLLNYMVLALLPEYMQVHFSWSLWLKAAGVYGCVALLGYVIASRLYLRNANTVKIDRDILTNQLHVLGPLRPAERLVAIAIVLFLVGVLTVPFHKIDTAWIAFYVMFFLLFFEVIATKEFRRNVDWTFLIVIATTIGISSVIQFLGVDLFLYEAFNETIGNRDLSSFQLMLLAAVFTFCIRIVLPLGPTAVVCGTLLIPLAIHHHIHPWVVAFTILVMCDVWVLRHQSPTYNLFKAQSQMSKKIIYDEKAFFQFNRVMNIIKIVGLIASIPLWQMMGMM